MARHKEDIVLIERVEVAEKAATGAAKAAPKAGKPAAKLLDLVLQSLDSDKGEDVISIALAGKSEMADHMVIASGRSSRQEVSMAEKLSERLKAELGRHCRMEGKETGDWVLIDCGDVVVHIFRPEVREFYQLEKMWLNPGDKSA